MTYGPLGTKAAFHTLLSTMAIIIDFALEQKWIVAFWKDRRLSTEIAALEVKQARGSTISYL